MFLEILQNSQENTFFTEHLRTTASININDPFGIKMLARLRLGYRHLREHKFRHDFNATLNPPSSSSIEAETTTHYFLHCHLYNSNRAPF